MAREELPLLAAWLAAPHVALWWREPSDLPSVERTYGPAIDGEDPTELLIAVLDGAPIGMLQRYRLADEPDTLRALTPGGATAASAGLDYLIGVPELTGRGYGSALIRQLSESTWRLEPAVDRIVVSVLQDNRPSWRALERAGYRRTWSGTLDSDDPSDAGLNHIYVLERP